MIKPDERFYNLESDFRSPYARDRDRIIHSESFRHLEYKTQVFLNQEGDFFRTRLTHSIEVSQVARSISSQLGLNENLAEAIALSHDLGHTPFGHVGGDALDATLKEHGHKSGFEHNFQSFRVVSSLEKRYKKFDGLNLTFATLEGILKHSYPYKKPFVSEKLDDIFRLDYHPSLEAMVVDRADEIAYISHDIDDGLQSGLITIKDLEESSLIQEVLKKVRDEGIEENDNALFRYRLSSHLINLLVYSLLDYSKGNITKERLVATKSIPIGFNSELETKIKKLKKILFQELYQHEQIIRKMFAGKEAVRGLFSAFSQEPKLLGKERIERFKNEKTHRTIADYIASLSDRYAMSLFNELYGRG